MGQKGKLHPDMSILESAELYGSMYGLNADVSKKRIKEIGKLLFLTLDIIIECVNNTINLLYSIR